ncbi:hypothetical protein PISMIDRAFT_454209 [Pisolithus microcarpus 441]|uniref:Uncharacterized protein n=1 Tax=Pisolithus microcarpus 441 TaxID=765257 RepID=A0A0C9ZME2_9AGAM|nr:hypothetical protein PISMIDRAFT_454209 [Pisolithus microcarpus 441]
MDKQVEFRWWRRRMIYYHIPIPGMHEYTCLVLNDLRSSINVLGRSRISWRLCVQVDRIHTPLLAGMTQIRSRRTSLLLVS